MVASKHHSYEIHPSAGFHRRPGRFAHLYLCLPPRKQSFRRKFENEAIAWYILAKGIFCSVALVALSRILDGVIAKLSG